MHIYRVTGGRLAPGPGWVDLDFDILLFTGFCLSRWVFDRPDWAGVKYDTTSK